MVMGVDKLTPVRTDMIMEIGAASAVKGSIQSL
jgi:hypothetical protein